MADNFKPGDFYRICERTGFKVRASDTRKEWTGAIVRKQSYEERHPQDFVRGRRDDQSVPDPRPRTMDNFVGPLVTCITEPDAAGSNVIHVENTARFLIGDALGVILRTGDTFRCVIDAVVSSDTIQLTTPLPDDTVSGYRVFNYTANAEVTH